MMNSPRPSSISRRSAGFTVLELLVASVVLVIIVGILLQMTASMADIWKNTSSKISAFQGARAGFDAMARALGQATLMSYYDYVDNQNPPQPRPANNPNWTPHAYARASELHFLSGPAFNSANPANSLVPGANNNNTQGHAIFFQAPLGVVKSPNDFKGLNNLLNAVGFFLEYADEKPTWPTFIQNLMGSAKRNRFRLMQWIQPSEQLRVYDSTRPDTAGIYSYSRDWIRNALADLGATSVPSAKSRARPIANNVVMLLFRPAISSVDEDQLDDGSLNNSATGGRLCPRYQYDSRLWTQDYGAVGDNSLRTDRFAGNPSAPRMVDLLRNQIPPLVEVAMIAITEQDAQRLAQEAGDSIPDALRLPPNTFHLRTGPASNAPSDFFEQDLQTYQDQLAAQRISFRTFRATIQVSGAKWSNE